jgi:polar amino acid transport system substrate-binding protein
MGAAAQAASHGGMKKVIIGTEGAYPPFNNLESDGSLVGFDIDIANALCAEMKVECEFVTQDWDGIIPALSPASSTPSSPPCRSPRSARRRSTSPTSTTTPLRPSPCPRTARSPRPTDAGLAGKMIGAQSSTTHSNYAEEKLPSAELKLYPTPDEYKLDIDSGRIDAVIDDVIVLSEWLKSDDGHLLQAARHADP